MRHVRKFIISEAAEITFEKAGSLEKVCPTQQTVDGAMCVMGSRMSGEE